MSIDQKNISKEAPECMHSFIYDYFEKRYIGLLDPKNQVRKVPFFPRR